MWDFSCAGRDTDGGVNKIVQNFGIRQPLWRERRYMKDN
jgi:hypothetical protein